MTVVLPFRFAAHLSDNVKTSRRCIRKQLGRVRKKAGEKAVHELRVELRRLAALLTVIETSGCRSEVGKALHSVKKRLEESSDLRDLQVQLELLDPMWPKFPEAAHLKKFLQRREEKLKSRFERRVKHTKWAGLNQRLKMIEKDLKSARGKSASDSANEPASVAVQRAFGNVAQFRSAVNAADARSIHHLRVAFKRFRYICELLQPFLPAMKDKQVNRMKAYQTMAGDIQDADVLLACLAKVVKRRKLSPVNLRRLRSELIDRKRRATERFMGRIDDVFEFRGLLDPQRSAQRRK